MVSLISLMFPIEQYYDPRISLKKKKKPARGGGAGVGWKYTSLSLRDSVKINSFYERREFMMGKLSYLLKELENSVSLLCVQIKQERSQEDCIQPAKYYTQRSS